jgi:hypothetical protein
MPLEHERFQSLASERTRHRQTDYTRAYHFNVNSIHGAECHGA